MILSEKYELMRKLYRQFAETEFTDEILEELEISPGTAKAILTRLTIKGLTKNHPGGRVSRK